MITIYELRKSESTFPSMCTRDMSQDARRKQIIWRAEHRGIREMDLLIGSFARQYVPEMDEVSLAEFEALIEVPDLDLYNWLLGRANVPDEYRTETFRKLCRHRFDGESYNG